MLDVEIESNRIELNRTHSLRRKHYSYFRGQLRGISTHTFIQHDAIFFWLLFFFFTVLFRRFFVYFNFFSLITMPFQGSVLYLNTRHLFCNLKLIGDNFFRLHNTKCKKNDDNSNLILIGIYTEKHSESNGNVATTVHVLSSRKNKHSVLVNVMNFSESIKYIKQSVWQCIPLNTKRWWEWVCVTKLQKTKKKIYTKFCVVFPVTLIILKLLLLLFIDCTHTLFDLTILWRTLHVTLHSNQLNQ